MTTRSTTKRKTKTPAAKPAAKTKPKRPRKPQPKPDVPRLLWSVPEAAVRLGISRSSLYRRCWDGRIAFVRDGGRVLVSDDELRRYVADLQVKKVRRRKARPKPADNGAGIEPAQRASA